MGKPTARGNTLPYQGLCYQAYFSRLLLLLQEPRQEHHPQQQLLDLRRREMLMSLSACLTKSWLQHLLLQTQSLLLLFIPLQCTGVDQILTAVPVPAPQSPNNSTPTANQVTLPQKPETRNVPQQRMTTGEPSAEWEKLQPGYLEASQSGL